MTSNEPTAQGGEKKSDTHQYDANDKPQALTPTSRDDRNHDSERSDRSPEPPNWVEKCSLVVLVLAFVAAAYAAYEADRLASLTDDLVRDGREAAAKAHADNVAALEKAAEANRIAREATINQLRPLVIVKSFSNFRTDPNGGFDLDVSMKNYGQTTADNVLMTAFFTPSYGDSWGKAEARRCTDVDNTRYSSGFQVAPTEQTSQPVNVYNLPVTSLGENNTIVSNDDFMRGTYFLLGCVIYNNRFKGHYRTKFCFRPIERAKSGSDEDVIAVGLKPCGFMDEAE